jgi:hypothetical protein
MAEKKDHKESVGFWAAIASGIGNSPLGALLGLGFCMALPILAGAFAGNWDGHLYDRKGCVQLQEMQGKVYKVDTCTGDVELLKIEEDKEDKDQEESNDG